MPIMQHLMKDCPFVFFIALFFSPGLLLAQKEEIRLLNASFEDVNKVGSPPAGWYDCGFPGETPPDVNPHPEFLVNKPAQDGRTYLGLVTRDNDTWEGVSQRLERPLQTGKCYSFSLWACRSDTYRSPTKTTRKVEQFTQPVKLVIWGGNSSCDKAEKLGETPLINNVEWKKFDMKFKPGRSVQYIFIEAYYKTPLLFSYNGNVLVDNASSLVVVPCEKNEPLADNPKPPVNVTPGKADPKPANPTVTTPPAPEAGKEPTSFSETLKGADVKVGQTFKMENIYFPADSTTLRPISFKEVDKLYAFLENNPNITIEIGGHTNNLPKDEYCDDLSTRRAKAVADYLIRKGMPPTRVKHKGYGKRNPIADNATDYGRKKNQRVEIKILKIE